MSGPIRAVCSMLAPAGRPLGRILEDRAMYSHYPMSKEVLVYYCDTVAYIYFRLWGEMTLIWIPKLLYHHTIGIILPMVIQIG